MKRDVEENYALVVTKKVDYEAITKTYYTFRVALDGAVTEYFTLIIINIDDNAPQIVPDFIGACYFEV